MHEWQKWEWYAVCLVHGVSDIWSVLHDFSLISWQCRPPSLTYVLQVTLFSSGEHHMWSTCGTLATYLITPSKPLHMCSDLLHYASNPFATYYPNWKTFSWTYVIFLKEIMLYSFHSFYLLITHLKQWVIPIGLLARTH